MVIPSTASGGSSGVSDQVSLSFPRPGGLNNGPGSDDIPPLQWEPCECHLNSGQEKELSQRHGGDATQAGTDGGDKGACGGGLLVAQLLAPSRRST